MKFRMLACMVAACCLLAGCNKNDSDSQESTTSKAESERFAETTAATEFSEETNSYSETFGSIPETAVLKVTQTTYRDGEAWQTLIFYRNNYGDSVASAYLESDGKEVITGYTEYEYDENGKIRYEKDISDSGEYTEVAYLDDNTIKTNIYDASGRLKTEGESTYDIYGNYIRSHNVVYNEDSEMIFEMSEDNSDCDYDENGNILVCRQRSESGKIISTKTNSYDENGNLLRSEEISADREQSGYYSKVRSCKYDDNNNLISEEEIGRSDADTVYYTETYEYQYDETGRKIRRDHRYINTKDDRDLTEYTLYEYSEL